MPGASDIYDRPWTRINAYLAGVWLGWILYKTHGRPVKLPGIFYTCLWMSSTAICLAVLYGIHPWYDVTKEIPPVAGYLYAGLNRFAWAVAICWIIFACIKGYGGPVNQFLSWSAFIPLARLCYSTYIVSFHVQQFFHIRLTVPIKADSYMFANIFFAHLVMSFLMGFVLTVVVESPFIILQKLIFEGSGPAKPVNDKPEVVQEKNEAGEEKNSETNNAVVVKD